MQTSMKILYDYIVEMEDTYRKKSKESKDKDFKKCVEAVITATTLIRVQMKDGGFQHEKEQIVKAFNEPLWITGKPNVNAEEYYNQTYNKNI